jgi:hypothetical protein
MSKAISLKGKAQIMAQPRPLDLSQRPAARTMA